MFNTISKNTTQAKVVDGKLILSCPGALTPVVWQMDLSGAASSAFEVKEDTANNQILLTSRKQGAQKIETIAPFAKKEEAVQALMATSRALENAHGHMTMATETVTTTGAAQPQIVHAHAPAKKSSWGKIALALMGIIIIFVLIGMIQSMKNYSPGSMAGSTSGTAASGGAQSESGVPMSADDFLRQN